MAAALASPIVAHAQIRAESSLSNFSYTLIDLLPDDGIGPSLSIVPPKEDAGGSQVSSYIRQFGTVEPEFDDNRTQSTTRYHRDLAIKLGTPAGTGNVSVTGTDFHSLQLRTLASTTSTPATSRSVSSYASSAITEFVLSPGTQVSFFADFNGSTLTTLPKGNVLQERAQTQASFYLQAYVQGQQTGFESTLINVAASNGKLGDSPPATMDASERVWITFDNNSALSSNLKFTINLVSLTHTDDVGPLQPSPVPEPASTAMLLAGLALVTGAARRRRTVRGK
ncbi:PEP-CTERM sorting domain-containing protein [Massilia sp. CCM 8734]|uniref:PEP-CTERM sorting domain-containing protein n=1 Tax=Massilia sp. CCM 8734 TaxID=2609283 RepID=UPI001AAE5852|nr:PEP-CTERM sorting domain-containing protein [Massilia sp. CCM 8734]